MLVREIRCLLLAIFMLSGLVGSPAAQAGAPLPYLSEEQFAPIARIVEKAVRDGKTPGAVVLIGNSEQVLYRRAFGERAREPEPALMTEDTIFDLASLTKAVATATAVMQLVEKGVLGLDAPAAAYWPGLGKNGKAGITLRHLLTHYSGLRPSLRLNKGSSGYEAALRRIVAEKPVQPPGSRFVYSDINFQILGEIVRRSTGQTLDAYCAAFIFRPLGMQDTGFKPSPAVRSRTAPTVYRGGRMACGEVHDPACFSMGGVAGHAGLFSTADDLARFARMMLQGGRSEGGQILQRETVEQMTLPQSPAGKKRRHGLGWDLGAPFAANAGTLSPLGAYGHLGYTGTALWIDPVTKIYLIILTNRVHPHGGGDVKALRAQIKATLAQSLGPLTHRQLLDARPALAASLPAGMPAGEEEGAAAMPGPAGTGKLQTGIDVLGEEGFAPLTGLRVGLITNHTGRDAAGRRTADLLFNAPGVNLQALFSPEHGLGGRADEFVPSSRDSATGLPVYSLYGPVRRPTGKMLAGLDALVFDVQDAGVRFYTYITTLGYALEEAAKAGLTFYVLDRPNPLTASCVQGPLPDGDRKSFTSYFPLPVRHGMTVGELAGMFNAEGGIGAKLRVIKMRGYRRTDWYDETGRAWINPSPNLRSLVGATLYPGVALVEGANVSVGRGTPTPFELLGAPWIDGEKLSGELNRRAIPGVTFRTVAFTPESSSYKKHLCRGVRLTLTDRQALDSSHLGIELISALHRLYPEVFRLDATLGLVGARQTLEEIRQGRDPRAITLAWEETLAAFLKLRAGYLLY